MIELSIYLWTVGFLITIIGLFLAHYLREPRVKSAMSAYKVQNSALRNKDSESQAIILDLKNKTTQQQEQITEQMSKMNIFSKYTFDPLVGSLISISESKRYCTACILKFKESPLGVKDNPLKCPECGADYNGPPRWIAVHQSPPDDPFQRIR